MVTSPFNERVGSFTASPDLQRWLPRERAPSPPGAGGAQCPTFVAARLLSG